MEPVSLSLNTLNFQINLKMKRKRIRGRNVCVYACICRNKGAADVVVNKSCSTH